MTQDPPLPRATRLQSIDIVRGLVMVLMCLDHVRDFYGDLNNTPEFLATTNPGLFATRWVTHFCAPAFVFLAGVSAYLAGARRTHAERTRFLVSRGLWLILLELTLVNFGWVLMAPLRVMIFQVIWVIGASFLALAALAYLPRPAHLVLGIACVAGQHALSLDAFTGSSSWPALFYGGVEFFQMQGPYAAASTVVINYSLLPWLGVMLLGYGLAPVFQREAAARRRTLLTLGIAGILLFVVVRACSGFGNIAEWSYATHAKTLGEAGRNSWWWHVIAFLNPSKYPPSLAFVLMTLGPTCLLLAWFDREPGFLGRRLLTFGRVPLLYYVAHLFVAHLGAGLLLRLEQGTWTFPLRAAFQGAYTEDMVHSLATVYLAWFACLAVLYPVCVVFGKWKRAGTSWVWSYL